MNAKDFRIRPHSTLIQILNNVPGLVVAQHQGGSKAPQWFLRGFDADHGTDIAVFADDMPINFVTHAHGQGYADPNFLIPETIDRIELARTLRQRGLRAPGPTDPDERGAHRRLPQRLHGGAARPLPHRPPGRRDRRAPGGGLLPARPLRQVPLAKRRAGHPAPEPHQHQLAGAQFEDNSCVRSQEQSRDSARPCFSKPGKNPVTPPGAIHFTPGNPIGVRAGVSIFF
jgi:hypothetical protein